MPNSAQGMGAQVFKHLIDAAGVESFAVGGEIAAEHSARAITDALAGVCEIYTGALADFLYPVVRVTYGNGSERVGTGVIRANRADGAANYLRVRTC